jgi:hypothetical protein
MPTLSEYPETISTEELHQKIPKFFATMAYPYMLVSQLPCNITSRDGHGHRTWAPDLRVPSMRIDYATVQMPFIALANAVQNSICKSRKLIGKLVIRHI